MRRLRLHVFLITLIRIILNTSYRLVYPYLPVLAHGLGVDEAAISLAISGRSLIGAAGALFASIADNRGRKTGMLIGLGIYASGISLVVFWPAYASLFLALILSNLGSYLFLPAIQAYLGDHIPYENRGLIIAITELSWSLSFIIGIPLAGFLMARSGWAAPFPILMILSIAAFLLILWQIPADQPPQQQASLLRNLRSVLTYGPALAGLGLGLSLTMANELVNVVFGIWLENSFGLQIAALGATALVIGISEFSGESLSGALVDRLGKPRSIAAGLLLNCLAVLLLPLLGKSPAGATAGLFFFYLTFEFSLVSSIPLMTEVMPEARATLMAANIAAFSLGRALGASLAIPIFHYGILANALSAVGANLLGWMLLSRIKLKEAPVALQVKEN